MSDIPAIAARLDMGLVIRRTFGVIGRNPASIAVLSVALALLGVLLTSLVEARLPASAGPYAGLATTLLGLVVNGISASCLTQVALNDADGLDARLGPVLRAASRVVVPVIALNLVVSIGVGLASLLLIFPGLMLLTRWFVVVPVRVKEDTGLSDALRRSAALTRGNRWRIFGLFVIYGVLIMLVGFILGGLAGGLGALAQARAAFDPAVIAANVVTMSITTACGSIGIAMIYAELRRTRHGAPPDQLAAVFE